MLEKGSRDYTRWSTTELLCNLEKGTVRAAVDGVEIARYTHPYPAERKNPERRIIPGPVGMFRHGAGASEYSDVYLEDDLDQPISEHVRSTWRTMYAMAFLDQEGPTLSI
jgi:hypothetical protein